jgi:hypothetical protein
MRRRENKKISCRLAIIMKWLSFSHSSTHFNESKAVKYSGHISRIAFQAFDTQFYAAETITMATNKEESCWHTLCTKAYFYGSHVVVARASFHLSFCICEKEGKIF